MSGTDLAMHLVVAVAAFCQSVTGIGFGMIAGPVLLVMMDDRAAILVSTLMSWLIALVLLPMLWRAADRRILLPLAAGALAGLAPGLWLLSVADVAMLKLLAGAVVGTLTLMTVFGAPGTRRAGRSGDIVSGGLGGLLGGCLSMPGPTVAVRLAALGRHKAAVRATMVVFFAVVWPPVFAGQALAIGVEDATLRYAALLVPATLVGLLAGHAAAGRVSERLFRRGVQAFLLATSASLLGGAAWSWMSA